MARYKMVVLSRSVEGREAEFNDWYQHVHLGEMVTFQGFKSAQRFRRVRNLGARETDPHLAIYEIETDDINAVMAELETRADAGELTMSEAFAREFVYAAVYEECGAVVGARSQPESPVKTTEI
jgi:hypothetical protein